MTASVTALLYSMRDGEEEATRDLLNHFLPRLRVKLANSARQLRLADEDDIAFEAFFDLCIAVQNSRFKDIKDRTQLWQILSMIAVRKANDFKKREFAQRRGGCDTVVSLSHASAEVAGWEQRTEMNVQLLEQCEIFLKGLDDSTLRRTAKLKFHGLTNQEIANKLGVSRRSVQYMMVKIKQAMQVAFA